MKTLLTITIGILLPVFVIAQEGKTIYDQHEIELIGVAEKMPAFTGGEEALLKFIRANTRYTQKAIDDSVKGTVYVNFVIDVSGEMSNVKILRGIHPDLDSIAIKVLNDMPKWIPAENRDIPIRTQFNIGIGFDYSENWKTIEDPVPSDYWIEKGKRKFHKVCESEYRMTQKECDCWYRFIIWNYNNRELKYIDLDYLFRTQKCN